MASSIYHDECDICGQPSDLYDRWPTCRDCLLHVCENCDSEEDRSEPDVDGQKTLCKECKRGREGAGESQSSSLEQTCI